MNVRTREALRDEEGQSGGFVKTQRTRPRDGGRPEKNKTPRRREFPEEPVVALPVVSEVSAAKPPEEKEEKEMESNNNAQVKDKRIPFPVPGFEICPVCGQYSKRVVLNGKPYLVCKRCDDKFYAYVKECEEQYCVYADKMAAELVLGKDPVVLLKIVQSKFEWTLSQLDIALIGKELEDARFMMETHNRRYQRRAERITERIQAKVSGKTLPQEVLVSLRNLFEKEVTQEDAETAGKDGARVRHLSAWLKAATNLRADLEKTLAEKAADEAAAKVVTCNPEAAPETPASAPAHTTALQVLANS